MRVQHAASEWYAQWHRQSEPSGAGWAWGLIIHYPLGQPYYAPKVLAQC